MMEFVTERSRSMSTIPSVEMPAVGGPPGPAESPAQEDRHYELIDGDWVEKNMGARASRIALRIGRFLDDHADAHDAGLVFNSECGYKVFPYAPKLVRYPDTSFVRKGRLPNDEPPDGHMTIPPDLAVEVVSPNDVAEEIEERLMDYYRVGVPLIWVIYPNARCVRVVRKAGTASQLSERDALEGEDVLPGFVLPLAQLFGKK
jgi:Uma2 family endonuclease